MQDLPKEVLIIAFTYLGILEAASLARTNKAFNTILNTSQEVWHSWWVHEGWLFKAGSKQKDRDEDSDEEREVESEEVKQVMNVKNDEKGELDWHRYCKVRYEYEYSRINKHSDICWVAMQGNAKAIRKLVSLGAGLQFIKGKNTTPLHCASERGNTQAIKALIELKADVNASRGVAPLHVAARYARNEAVDLLLALGAQVNCTSANHSTPLHFAAHGSEETVRILVTHGADVNACNTHEDTPLHEAADCANLGTARALMRMGANTNARNKEGCTPLHLAAERPHAEMVRELIRNGADVNAMDSLNVTAYNVAVWRANVEVQDVLVELGAKTDKPPDGAWFIKSMKPTSFTFDKEKGRFVPRPENENN